MELPTGVDLDDFDHGDGKNSDSVYVHAKKVNENNDTEKSTTLTIPSEIHIW